MHYKTFSKLLLFACLLVHSTAWAQELSVTGPDENLSMKISVKEGIPYYSVVYKGKQMLEDSPLGLQTNVGDFRRNLSYVSHKENTIDETYALDRIKTSRVHCVANELTVTLQNEKKQEVNIVFRVSKNDIAFRYTLPQFGEAACLVIEKEASGFKFPAHTTTFLTPQALPMTSWKRTKPSYEEEYIADEPIGTSSKYGVGYTFPGLFHVGDDGWVLLSETGVDGSYCGSKLSEGTKDGLYTIAFPEEGENNGIGSAAPAMALPGSTPWRTITVGDNLKPIVETTVPFDVVKPRFEPSKEYTYGRSVWSWIMWQDHSMNYKDQITYIDMAAAMGYEFILVDALWDTQLGRDGIKKLVEYARSKNVSVLLWYNSNGSWNDAPQGPKHCMNTAVAREKEMAWMKSLGIKGIKVDFFGGDKQETMQLYEDILSDANRHGILVIFHGCTLPRGWERMYPNYVGSEAVMASENLIFSQRGNDFEAYNATLHPFIRNAVGCMEFGPVLLNKRHNRGNNGGSIRRTTDIFQLATAVLFQNPVQAFALAPNNMTDVPTFEIDYMKEIPTTWDETRFIDGYPGKYVVLARRSGNKWYLVAVNAQKETLKLKVNLDIFADSSVTKYYDDKKRTPQMEEIKIGKKGDIALEIQPEGAVILKN